MEKAKSPLRHEHRLHLMVGRINMTSLDFARSTWLKLADIV
jgi:hypothetical protein